MNISAVQKCFSLGWGSCGRQFCGGLQKTIQTYQLKVQKWVPVMVWAYSMDDFHVCKSTIDTEVHTGVLERHTLPTRQQLFLGRKWMSGFFSKTVSLLQQCVFIDTEYVCMPAVYICFLLKMYEASQKEESNNGKYKYNMWIRTH